MASLLPIFGLPWIRRRLLFDCPVTLLHPGPLKTTLVTVERQSVVRGWSQRPV